MSFKSILSFIRTAAHAVSMQQLQAAVIDEPTSLTGSKVSTLVGVGLIKQQAGGRNAGKFYTHPDKRSFVDELLSSHSPSVGAVYSAIKNAPSSVTSLQIAAMVGNFPGSHLTALVNIGAIKQHRRKAGFYFTNPDRRGFFTELFGVWPADVAQNQSGPFTEAEVAAIRRLLASQTTAAPSVDPVAVAAAEITPPVSRAAVLAMLRLAGHGVSINDIVAQLEALAAERIIRTDRRDENVDADAKRYFVRRSKREGADHEVGVLIATKENCDILDQANEEAGSF